MPPPIKFVPSVYGAQGGLHPRQLLHRLMDPPEKPQEAPLAAAEEGGKEFRVRTKGTALSVYQIIIHSTVEA